MSFGMSITEEKFLKALTGIAKNTGRIADALEAMNVPEIAEEFKYILQDEAEEKKADDRPRGYWINASGYYGCSACGGGSLIDTDFCGNCGAYMERTAE